MRTYSRSRAGRRWGEGGLQGVDTQVNGMQCGGELAGEVGFADPGQSGKHDEPVHGDHALIRAAAMVVKPCSSWGFIPYSAS